MINKYKHYILIECGDEDNYPFSHNYNEILGENYVLETKSKIFYPPIKRWIEVYKRKDNIY